MLNKVVVVLAKDKNLTAAQAELLGKSALLRRAASQLDPLLRKPVRQS